jgi:hypothetical protein
MPNRVRKKTQEISPETISRGGIPGLRKAILEERARLGGRDADLVRAIQKKWPAFDQSYLGRLLRMESQFKEEKLMLIAEALNLPVYVGELPKTEIIIEKLTKEEAQRKGVHFDFVTIPVYAQDAIMKKPFRHDPNKVQDVAYMSRKSFQAFNLEELACTKIPVVTEKPLVRKDAIICISMGTLPPEQAPAGSVWAAQRGDHIVIGTIHFRAGDKILLAQRVHVREDAEINADDILGRVLWGWHSMI